MRDKKYYIEILAKMIFRLEQAIEDANNSNDHLSYKKLKAHIDDIKGVLDQIQNNE